MIPRRTDSNDQTNDGGSRVRRSHDFTRAALTGSAVFAAVAVVWSVVILVSGGSWWGPIHAFLAGTILLAISGTSQMFTVTWATTSPPTTVATTTQRWLLAGGVALVLIGVPARIDAFVWMGASAVAISLIVLGTSINAAIRRSLLRRFDLASRFYLVAFGCGVVGVLLGAVIGTGDPDVWFLKFRLVHSHLNLMGLVGLTIIGTLPTFLATTAHHRAVSGREATRAWWIGTTGAILIVFGIWWPRLVGAGTIAIGVSGAVILAGVVWRLWDRGRHKLAFVQISLGVTWLIVWAVADGVRVMGEPSMVPFAPFMAVAIVGGVAQVLVGALTYLIPVLKGSPFPANRATLQSHPWLPIASANVATVLFIAGASRIAFVFVGVWVLDFAVKAVRVVARK